MIRASAVQIMECSVVLPSNKATTLDLFGESVRIDLHSCSIRTNRVIVLKSNCIRSMAFSSEQSFGLDYRDNKESVLLTSWVVFSSCIFSVVSRQDYKYRSRRFGPPLLRSFQ